MCCLHKRPQDYIAWCTLSGLISAEEARIAAIKASKNYKGKSSEWMEHVRSFKDEHTPIKISEALGTKVFIDGVEYRSIRFAAKQLDIPKTSLHARVKAFGFILTMEQATKSLWKLSPEGLAKMRDRKGHKNPMFGKIPYNKRRD